MQQHVKILAFLHIVLGSLGVLAGLVVLTVFGGLAGLIRFGDHGQMPSAFFGFIGLAVTCVVLIFSLPGLLAGVGLLTFQPWARILTIIISALELPAFPLHTALGIYGLWVLLSNQGAALFERPWNSPPNPRQV